MAGEARHGAARWVLVRCGGVWRGAFRCGKAWYGSYGGVRSSRCGTVRLGKDWYGSYGVDRLGEVRFGEAWQGRYGNKSHLHKTFINVL